LQSAAGYTYTYDNEGNRLKRTKTGEVTDYTWDYRNRLTKVETKSGTTVVKSASYIYDVFDRRIGRSMYPDGLPTIPPVAERRFVYDRDHILLSFDNNNNLTHRFLYGPVLDMVLADDSNGNILWTLADNLGTVRDLVNSSGVVQNHRKYDSFGNITSQSNAGITTRFSYTGREFDADTGLYFYRSRYYDPLVGRFISEDPISFIAGDTNLYRYVGNSSTNATDPFGLEGDTVVDVFGRGLGAAVGAIWAGIVWLFTQPRQPQAPPQPDTPLAPKPIRPQPQNPRSKPSPRPTPNPKPTPWPTPIPHPPSCPDDPNCKDKKKTCKDVLPKLIPCAELPGQYSWADADSAAKFLSPNGRREEGYIAEKGPCGKDPTQNPNKYTLGYHYNVKKRNGRQAGSVGQCECCEENGGNPKKSKRGAILSSEPH
jgi:RHS repeat-associated protein